MECPGPQSLGRRPARGDRSEKLLGDDLTVDMMADEAPPSLERTPLGRRGPRSLCVVEIASRRSFGRQNLDNFG
jgi:hypothetical protein